MRGPTVATWIEKLNDIIFEWIDRRQIRTLATIAVRARQSKIVEGMFATVLASNHVFNLRGD